MTTSPGFVPMGELRYPQRCRSGDRVAIVSPSSGLAGVFPHILELGLRRLVDRFGVIPVEYPTTRRESTPAERAADLMSAFTDPTIAAVVATLGGDDQIMVLPHLDLPVIASQRKPYFGYSDSTNLLNALMLHGLVGYHGGSVMVQFGRQGRMHPITEASLRSALLTGGRHRLTPATTYANTPRPWGDLDVLIHEPPTRPASPWTWHGPARRVEGRCWGGCLEILDWTAQVGRWIAPAEHYAGSILFVETSEEMVSADYVYRVLRNLGLRGILDVLAGLVVARPVSERLGGEATDREIELLEQHQRRAVLDAVALFRDDLPIVIGVDAGHTDPQQVIPIGGIVELDTEARTLHVVY
jgi:muramoyltetrapeptide carboxypeptidase LdcA involved in peptidoglycan recycling